MKKWAVAWRSWGSGNCLQLGRSTLRAAALQVHHISLRRRSSNGPGNELVARAESNFMVEAVEIRTGIRRQSGSRRQSCRAVIEQEGHADNGRNYDRPDAQLF